MYEFMIMNLEEHREIICMNSFEFMIMKSYYEFMCEFSAMENIVKSWLNS